MQIAQKRDALRKGKFYFQRSIFPAQHPSQAQSAHYGELEMMEASTIFNGKVSCILYIVSVGLTGRLPLACNRERSQGYFPSCRSTWTRSPQSMTQHEHTSSKS